MQYSIRVFFGGGIYYKIIGIFYIKFYKLTDTLLLYIGTVIFAYENF